MFTHLTTLSLCSVLLAGAGFGATKTNFSEPVDDTLVLTEPYRFNGLVQSGGGRGSGFLAINEKLFFTAAHVVFVEDTDRPPGFWLAPPEFHHAWHSDSAPGAGVSGRGYFRWSQYANVLVDFGGQASRAAFSKDLVLVYSLDKPFGAGPVAPISYAGRSDLSSDASLKIITGYPAEVDYLDIGGTYKLHTTAPDTTPFIAWFRNAMQADLISTGPGNSGGPIMVQDRWGKYIAAGILVGGRPSETIVHAFDSATRNLVQAAEPLTRNPMQMTRTPNHVGATSYFAGMQGQQRRIPDGVKRWTKIPLNFGRFTSDAVVTSAKVTLDISTGHRGDLVVQLQAPGGAQAVLHNGEGGDEDDLVFIDEPIGGLTGISANGSWYLLVQDRLAGDVAVINKFVVEIGLDGVVEAP